ncbi:glycoside hydrolase family 18 protein [Aaosphaeria arxii CBS 175.79]|uniref:chitinase n=1 Tax=Aaosphaeria arxii CBS 175.79 TaxID=1450172 RepID=A0A6A5XFP5_9PLEO|nr:glycoside hydrolase family 18 protein [Aaosphaeria arxii CBS 175.79]KAF2011760.1 glycoside hydrolase family 18 protein [Aaosphaeria arxii CBS 175.79]
MTSQGGYRSVAYFVNWGIYGRKYTPDKIPVEKLTHILYAFADNNEDGTVKLTDTWSDVEIHYPTDSWNDVGNNLYGNMKQLNIFKRRNRNLKVMLSIGGWTYAHEQKHFDGPAGSPEGRRQFAKSCVDLIRDLGFDGIDIDWEYPQNEGQGEQLVLLLKEIRAAMDEYAEAIANAGNEKPYFELSIAAPAGKTNYDNLPLGKVGEVVDFINLMGYDFAGSWDKTSGHQANLYASSSCPSCTPFNIDSVITDYTADGIPSDKIVLGMPLYGRAFTNTKGLGQPYEGVGEGSWEKGIWDFKALPKDGAQEMYDEESGASYSYDEGTQTLISYDTADMARKKVDYIKNKGLGGAMWWELSGDREDEGSLISTVVADLGTLEAKPNNINYPDSKYENLKAGFPNDS